MLELRSVFANEWMKLIRRKRMWVAAVLGALVVGLFALGTYHDHQTQLRYNSPSAWQQQVVTLKQDIARQKAQKQTAQTKAQIQADNEQIKSLQGQIAAYQNDNENWRQTVRNEISQTKQDEKMAAAEHDSTTMSMDQGSLLRLNYQLAHNVPPLVPGEQSAYQEFTNFISVATQIFLPLLAVILVADMVSGETTRGTIKLLFIRPVSRFKILFGKWLASMAATAALTVAVCVALLLVGCGILGTGGAKLPELVGTRYTFVQQPQVSGQVVSTGPSQLNPVAHYAHTLILPEWQFVVYGILLTTLAMLVVATIAFLCSALFKSAMASTAVALGVVIIGGISVSLVHSKVVVALFPTHLNLFSNWTGALAEQLKMSVTLTTGLVVLATWGIVCLIASLLYFTRKDVLNA
ncbi:ABC transporter permease subunit [Alicyclobacillus suci]|uniref:ABC transporter permease subunit n=1 Tax=Alicyclobacillus suci TaxID=2816080 RepID=UPI001A907B5C|nr:ABC transporter permease subunit [Alicyclobacillus suci]